MIALSVNISRSGTCYTCKHRKMEPYFRIKAYKRESSGPHIPYYTSWISETNQGMYPLVQYYQIIVILSIVLILYWLLCTSIVFVLVLY